MRDLIHLYIKSFVKVFGPPERPAQRVWVALGVDVKTQADYEHAAQAAFACGVTPAQIKALSKANAQGFWTADTHNGVGLPTRGPAGTWS